MNLISELMRSVREEGVTRTSLKLWAHIQDLIFDIRYKTDTLRWQDLNSLSVVGENKVHGVFYQPTQARTLRKVLKSSNLSRDGAFLDLGCGKARTLILAAEFGYIKRYWRRVSELLCRIAQTNLVRYSEGLSPVIEYQIIHADAAEYAIPQDVRTVFLFNPFDAVIMAKVVKNIEASLRKRPRELHIIYRHPLQRKLIDSSGMFEVAARYSFPQCDFLVSRFTGQHKTSGEPTPP